MYANFLAEFGLQIERRIKAHTGGALHDAASINYDEEVAILAEAAKIIQRDIFRQENPEFNGYFKENCEEDFLSSSMIAIVSMILLSSVNSGSRKPNFKQAVLTISQLLVYNSTKATRELSTSVFHSKKREPPIAIYLGNLIHAETRKSGVVDKLCKLGLSISSDRVDFISKSLGNRAVEQFEQNEVIYPINM